MRSTSYKSLNVQDLAGSYSDGRRLIPDERRAEGHRSAHGAAAGALRAGSMRSPKIEIIFPLWLWTCLWDLVFTKELFKLKLVPDNGCTFIGKGSQIFIRRQGVRESGL